MALFGRKSKRNETAACCAGNCNDESMAAQNAISLKPLQKRH